MFDWGGVALERAAAKRIVRARRYRAALAMLAIVFVATAASAASSDEIVVGPHHAPKIAYSFVFMGCNRVLKGDKSVDNPSTANLPQLLRSFTEIAALKPRPDFVVFTGDMVLGLTANLPELQRQLEA